MSTTTLIAILVAVIGAAGLMLSLYNTLRDHANIVLSFETENEDEIRNFGWIVIVVKNKGRRPVTVKKVEFTDRKNTYRFELRSPSNGFVELKEGKSARYVHGFTDVDWSKVRYVMATDATDRTYKTKVSKFLTRKFEDVSAIMKTE